MEFERRFLFCGVDRHLVIACPESFVIVMVPINRISNRRPLMYFALVCCERYDLLQTDWTLLIRRPTDQTTISSTDHVANRLAYQLTIQSADSVANCLTS